MGTSLWRCHVLVIMRLHFTLKSEAGKTEYLQPFMSNLLHDKVASNLYWHMADGLVSRLVFTNPFALGVQRVRLQLATQMIDVLDLERGRLIEYSQLGYTPYEYQDEAVKRRNYILSGGECLCV